MRAASGGDSNGDFNILEASPGTTGGIELVCLIVKITEATAVMPVRLAIQRRVEPCHFGQPAQHRE
jgi:hypothetical protein